MNLGIFELSMMILYPVVGILIIYFVIKSAVKNAIKELKEEGHL
ncbi:hypothetical protein Tfer_1449 [Thermincola ferriacetica]|uniref:Uncharacterized protein n=2 Tax=Thermincola TaxID=278993 RepID=D5XC01_THEPJ|nr:MULTISPECIES: hypothetical protein [Thermincola]ADG81549.1 conserved hypothetical protein [Thermincola potens JR]KNZ69839.1 hypothetical protein Tfer_1449 [Thermincola ferriacetica]